MQVKDIINALRERQEFKCWHDKNKNAKLVHLFLMLDPTSKVSYDVGFYDFTKKLMTSFILDETLNSVDVNESKEIFTKDDSKIKPLDESKIKISFKDACSVASTLQKEKYKQHLPLKEIVVLQNLELGQVWNITYVTKTFQTLNIKVDAENGKILDEKLQQIFSFDK